MYKLLIFIFIILSFKLFAQEPAFQIVNQNNGLSSNIVYDMIQDGKGYIWIAGEKGLSKFDGVNFIHYSNKKQNSKSLSNIIEYKLGEVYVQNFSGQIFRTSNDSLIYIEKLSNSGNYYQMQKTEDMLFSFDMYGIYATNITTNKTNYLKTNKPIFENTWQENDEIFFITELGELKNFKKNSVNTIAEIPQLKNRFNKIIKCKKGFVFIQKNQNDWVYFFKDNSLTKLKGIEENVIVNKICTIDNKIWICTTNGIYIFDENFNQMNQGLPLFKQFNTSTIIKDKSNSYWISTIDNGLLFIENLNIKKYSDIFPTSICKKDDNTAIFGTIKNEGYEYNLKENKVFKLFQTPYPNQIVDCYYDQKNQTSIFASNSTKFYKKNKFIYEDYLAIKCIKKIWDNTYFVAYSGGACVIDFGKNKKTIPNWLIKMPNSQRYFFDQTYKRTKTVEYYHQDSTFVIGNVNGLYFQKRNSKIELKFKNNTILGNDLLINNSKLYIASSNLGLLVYDFKTNKLEQIETQYEIDNFNKVKMHGEYLYFSSDNVLFKYHLLSKTFQKWNCENGISKDEIKDFEVFENQYVVCLNTGVIHFSDNEFNQELEKPTLYINKIINNENGKLLNIKNLKLPFEENNLNILFSVPFYKNIKSLAVYYKINNSNWIKLLPTQRELPLASLEPNKYNIQIKAISASGIESKIEQLEIIILPPFYKTWWFILIVIAAILFIIYCFFKFRTNQLKRKQKLALEKEELNRQIDLSTLKTLRAQMNPHFIYNSLNSIQSYVYSGEKELASKYLGLFSDLSRSLLDSSNLQEISLYDELKLIDLYLQLECIRLPKIKYEIIKNEDLQEHDIYIPAMIVQPLVENAIKHGLANKADNCLLKINISSDTENIKIEIDDNGIGRKKAEELNKGKRNKPESFATKSIENRISLLNKNRSKKITQNITDKFKNQEASGTLVTLIIPINYND